MPALVSRGSLLTVDLCCCCCVDSADVAAAEPQVSDDDRGPSPMFDAADGFSDDEAATAVVATLAAERSVAADDEQKASELQQMVDEGKVEIEDEANTEIEAAEPARCRGRPRRVDPSLDAPVWPDQPPAATQTLHALLADLFGVAADNNLSETAVAQLFGVLQKHLPVGHAMPSHAHAVDMLLRQSPVQLHTYVACTNDCQLFGSKPGGAGVRRELPMTLEGMSEVDSLRLVDALCDRCSQRFCDKRKRIQKVRAHAHTVNARSGEHGVHALILCFSLFSHC